MEEEEKDLWLDGSGDGLIDEEEEAETRQQPTTVAYSSKDLEAVIARLKRCREGGAGEEHSGNFSTITEKDYVDRSVIVRTNVSSWGDWYRGEMLREVGAIDALMFILSEVHDRVVPGTAKNNTTTAAAFDLATACWQSLRELACGSIGNRTAIRLYKDDDDDGVNNGLELMTNYLRAFSEVGYREMDCHDLDIVTSVIGVMQNVTHKTPENCKPIHDYGASELLIEKLLVPAEDDDDDTLPNQSRPWREACFRAAVTLINIMEEYEPCLDLCSKNAAVIPVLLESWGKNKRLKGLFRRLLQAARRNLCVVEFKEDWEELIATKHVL